MQNYRLKISYEGTRYHGWEHQPGKETVQGKLEMVLARMCGLEVSPEDFFGEGAPLELIGAGRTDAGVHARGMVASVKLSTALSPEEIRDYMNRYLPDDIAVTEVKLAAERFHARYNAAGKTYRYTFFQGPVKPVFDRKLYTPLYTPLDVEAMRRAAVYLTGEHDFKSFCGNGRYKKSTVRTVDLLEIKERKGYVTLTFHGNGFLQNMVRIMTGTLMEAGYHRMTPEEVEAALLAKDRRAAGPTAPARGLMLLRVDY